MSEAAVAKALRAALEHEQRINLHLDEVGVEYSDGVACLSGEVANIAAKRLTLELAAALPEVTGIVDRLHVRPAVRMSDAEIADHLGRALLAEPSFAELGVFKVFQGRRVSMRPAGRARPAQWIEYRLDGGVVTLDGDVPSLSHKRLAGAIAWWVPGSRDVVNGLGVEPDEADSEQEILDALRLVLEKDPLIDATQIAAGCKGAIVTLRGVVPADAMREAAEFDAWALFGVDDVRNLIEVVHS